MPAAGEARGRRLTDTAATDLRGAFGCPGPLGCLPVAGIGSREAEELLLQTAERAAKGAEVGGRKEKGLRWRGRVAGRSSLQPKVEGQLKAPQRRRTGLKDGTEVVECLGTPHFPPNSVRWRRAERRKVKAAVLDREAGHSLREGRERLEKKRHLRVSHRRPQRELLALALAQTQRQRRIHHHGLLPLQILSSLARRKIHFRGRQKNEFFFKREGGCTAQNNLETPCPLDTDEEIKVRSELSRVWQLFTSGRKKP